jgi:hypothetical protein
MVGLAPSLVAIAYARRCDVHADPHAWAAMAVAAAGELLELARLVVQAGGPRDVLEAAGARQAVASSIVDPDDATDVHEVCMSIAALHDRIARVGRANRVKIPARPNAQSSDGDSFVARVGRALRGA